MSSTTLTTTEIRAILARQEKPLLERMYRFDVRLTHWLARHSLLLLRVFAGVIFVWFGALKLVPGLSPLEPFIRSAFPQIAADGLMPTLAIWEMAIGLGFLASSFKRALFALLALHSLGTLLVMALRPELIFHVFPVTLTLEGQYVILSLVMFTVGLVVAATARGGGLTAEADALRRAREIERKVE